MTWLIKLYPPAWRRRYGRELAELIASQPASFGMAIDLVAAAIDAWLYPQSSTSTSTAAATSHAKGAGTMISRAMQLKCAGSGPNITKADNLKAAALVIGGTLVTTLTYLWITARYGRGPYSETLFFMSWLIFFIFSQHFTTLKGRRPLVQAVVIGGQTAVIVAIALLAAWINASRGN
jgi:hypothetical protein